MYRYAVARTFLYVRALEVATIFFLTTGLCACGTPVFRAKESPDTSAGSNVVLKMAGVNAGEANTLFAYFPLGQGEVIGPITTPSVMVIQGTSDGFVRLPLDELGRRVRPFAKQLRTELIQAGLSAEPEDLHIARIGTYIYDNNFELTQGAGILDQVANNSLALIYVDRPGAVKGTLPIRESGDEVFYIFDLKMPAAGIHWVRFKTLDRKHTELVIDDTPGLLVLSGN